MKFVLIFGSGAVGKMTVGQELMKLTGLKLFHNHMAIEPVIAVFGYYDGPLVAEIREAFFRRFAASDQPGMIFTFMWDFDRREDVRTYCLCNLNYLTTCVNTGASPSSTVT